MSAVLSEEDWPYAIRYAWNMTRGLDAPRLEEEEPAQPSRRGYSVARRTFTVWSQEMDAVVRADYAAHRDAGRRITPGRSGTSDGPSKLERCGAPWLRLIDRR